MKRPILIIISVITIFILLGTAVTFLFGVGHHHIYFAGHSRDLPIWSDTSK
jgi:hypothetical protein